MWLYHYYDETVGPFCNLSDLSTEEAKQVMAQIRREKPNTQCATRHSQYVEDRLYYEGILREKFIEKGGVIERFVPHYMVVEYSPWLSTWFEHSAFLRVNINDLDLRCISFTYGDSHPTFSPRMKDDHKEYRKKLYTFEEILKVIKKYGYPQDWNNDGKFGPERYIEAHIWTDRGLEQFLRNKA